MGLSVSDSAMLWVMCAPTGPYMSNGVRPLSLLALRDNIRAWPGGTGEYKIAGNYGPVLGPHQDAQEKGYDQTLWLLGEKITEAGVMNIFVVLRRDDGGELILISQQRQSPTPTYCHQFQMSICSRHLLMALSSRVSPVNLFLISRAHTHHARRSQTCRPLCDYTPPNANSPYQSCGSGWCRADCSKFSPSALL